ncbi:MAG: hypothetical protein COT74_00885 [Bdellovibrionales bacterium CG10_big_fil_rev_8_21_14_0_10_45_34]|nr:MAG: hypothetical protein COT74_00885 [Bdellovibrionales bacterium CG10_big_fil_rev_8_21_14_0_10_45_34]
MRTDLKRWRILFLINLFFLVAGYSFADRQGLLAGLILGFILTFLALYLTREQILRWLDAKPVEGQDSWGLRSKVAELAKLTKVPAPQIYLSQLKTPFLVVDGHSTRSLIMVVSEPLLKKLTKEERDAVLLAAMSWIRQGPLGVLDAATSLTNLFYLPASIVDITLGNLIKPFNPRLEQPLFFRKLVQPVIAALLRILIRKSRYFELDRRAVEWGASSLIYSQALEKLERYKEAIPVAAPESIYHLFLVNPSLSTSRTRSIQPAPETSERIKSLIGRYPV